MVCLWGLWSINVLYLCSSKLCNTCGGYNEAYGEVIACECKRLRCGCYGTCVSGHNVSEIG